tara:strand:+ start:6823 stop:7197 length:375 start_codon:yes stop_codon:yes gene_type:complete
MLFFILLIITTIIIFNTTYTREDFTIYDKISKMIGVDQQIEKIKKNLYSDIGNIKNGVLGNGPVVDKLNNLAAQWIPNITWYERVARRNSEYIRARKGLPPMKDSVPRINYNINHTQKSFMASL